MIMGNMKKYYIGGIVSEERAAKVYDKFAILTQGLRAKTNFSYRKSELEQLLKEEDSLTLSKLE